LVSLGDKVLLQLRRPIDEFAGVGKETTTCLSQGGMASAGAVEELGTGLLFKTLDVSTDGRLRDSQATSSARKRSGFYNRYEDLQATRTQGHHGI
jgi:hypothetical protein